MTATVLAGRRLTDELRDKRDEVEARLALGQPSRQAATPYVRAALRSALTPQIETTKATGLVFLPGAMTGLILAGVAPLQAQPLPPGDPGRDRYQQQRHGEAGPADRSVHGLASPTGTPVRRPSRSW